MLHHISKLPQNQKFVLGFSGGVDSSALFFLLLDYGVRFDLAIVNYGVREESELEVLYAQNLAKRYDKQIFILQAKKIERNFEANARKIRYEFFGQILQKSDYAGVILAHQLDDKLEWFLMQFSKGAGLNTLLGFTFCEKYQGFTIFRPLLEVSKKELYQFCQKRRIQYFEDSSNQNERFLRNQVRKISSFLMKNISGINASFQYLQEQKEVLYPKTEIEIFEEIVFFRKNTTSRDLHIIDLEFKRLGYVLSSKQKLEIVRCKFSCEIKDILIETNDSKIFIAPKIPCVMSKEFRDLARRSKFPKRLRQILYLSMQKGRDLDEIRKLLR